MKLALVHDHLTQEGGAEKVLKCFHDVWPKAPIFTLIYDKNKLSAFKGADVKTSFLQRFPLGIKKYQWFLPLMPLATERHDLMDYDIILSSSSAFSKGVITSPHTLHICYCHTPTRYLWTDTHSYVKELKANRLIKKIVPLVLIRLRLWDRITADRVDKFIANSVNVQKRIYKYYRRESNVLHPPVDTKSFRIADKIGDYYLIGGRLVGYKRYDIAIKAFNRLRIPLKIFGEGPAFESLKEMANSNIEFLGKVSGEELANLYSHCIAFLHPQEEDFGITAIEAMASGRPVIAFARGGALETVEDGVTGKFIDDQIWEALADAVIRFRPEDYNSQIIRDHALGFDTDVFKQRAKDYVEREWGEFKN